MNAYDMEPEVIIEKTMTGLNGVGRFEADGNGMFSDAGMTFTLPESGDKVEIIYTISGEETRVTYQRV